MKIILTRRQEDWHAHFTETSRASGCRCWGCGKTQNAAITDLVLTHHHVTQVQIHVYNPNEIDFVAELPFERLKWEAARTQSDAVGKLVRFYMHDFGIDAIEISNDEYTQRYMRRP
jgi:hypothetical protein